MYILTAKDSGMRSQASRRPASLWLTFFSLLILTVPSNQPGTMSQPSTDSTCCIPHVIGKPSLSPSCRLMLWFVAVAATDANNDADNADADAVIDTWRYLLTRCHFNRPFCCFIKPLGYQLQYNFCSWGFFLVRPLKLFVWPGPCVRIRFLSILRRLLVVCV